MATAAAVHNGAFIAALANTAPIQTAGQRRGPHSSNAARLMPVGGQTVVTCSATEANRNPTNAAAT